MDECTIYYLLMILYGLDQLSSVHDDAWDPIRHIACPRMSGSIDDETPCIRATFFKSNVL